MRQHLVLRNSSVTTGTSIVGLRADLVRYVLWWDHDDFGQDQKRLAAELVAFDVLQPTLRSRAGIRAPAHKLSRDDVFRARMTSLFEGAPAGRRQVLSLSDLAGDVTDLRQRVERLEALVRSASGSGP